MSTYTAKELCKILEQNGWVEVRQVGSHKQFKHPDKPNKITVPVTQIKKNIEMNVLKQAGLRHLIRRRNMKAQVPKPSPTMLDIVKPSIVQPFILDNQIIKEDTQPQKEDNNMPTLREIAKVSMPSLQNNAQINTTKLLPPTMAELILEYVENNPGKCRNTSAKKIALEVYNQNPEIGKLNSLEVIVNRLIKKGEIVRIPNKGKLYVGTFVVTHNDKTTARPQRQLQHETTQEDEPTVTTPLRQDKESAKSEHLVTGSRDTGYEGLVAPTVNLEKTPEGIKLSITLSININV